MLDALEQALHDRRPCSGGGPVHHSAHGSQYLSIRYIERLAEAGLEPSVGSVGDSYDNALAETNNGLTRPKSSGEKAYGNPWKPSNRHPRMSRLVQSPPPARAYRKHSPRQNRGQLFCSAEGNRYRFISPPNSIRGYRGGLPEEQRST